MPIYRLDGSAEVNLSANSAVQVAWVTRGSSAPVRIEALVDDIVTDTVVVRPRPDLLFIPPAAFPITLRVVPVGGAVFATPTEIEVQFAVGDQRSPDPEIVRLSPMNISGSPARSLVVIEQTGRATKLTALNTIPDPPLPELADKARAAARTVLGVDRLPATAAAAVVVAVDTSGSMLPFLREGTVAAVLDVLAGVAQVVTLDRQVRAFGVGSQSTALAHVPASELAVRAVAELEQSVLSSGFRSAAVPVLDVGPTVTYIVTDSVPADLDRRNPSQPAHLIALMSNDAWSILGFGAKMATSVLEPGTVDESTHVRLRHRPDELQGFVRSLLRPFARNGGSR